MTSLSRKNRRTTVLPTLAATTAIKLAALGLLLGTAFAQDAPPPFRSAAELPPILRLTPSDQRPTGQFMTFRKQPGDDRPAANPETLPQSLGKVDELYVSLPSRAQAFRLDDDTTMEQRILRELKKADREENKFANAPEVAPKGAVYKPKTESYPPIKALVEPGYVTHRRLYFEELNSERYGWDMGVLQPAISTLHFYKDVLMWPGRLASNPHEHYEASSGKCLPGNPVPYYVYPPGIDIWGYAAMGALYTGVGFLVPTP